MHGAIK